VVSAWGEEADWYRNLQKSPAVEVRTGRERYKPLQRFLSPEEAYAEHAGYERRHPWQRASWPGCSVTRWAALKQRGEPSRGL
jgi:F420H(2)-dependent quinone reductase